MTSSDCVTVTTKQGSLALWRLMLICRCKILMVALQTVHIIRHGESEYNAATQYNKGFDDPQIYDPKLTAKGRRQVWH